MKKTDILYLLLIMLIVYAISFIIFGNDPNSKRLVLNEFYNNLTQNQKSPTGPESLKPEAGVMYPSEIAVSAQPLINEGNLYSHYSNNDTQYPQEWLNDKVQDEDYLLYGTVQVSSDPVINARSALVMDFETGTILYEKNAYRKRPMASTTKIMSAIIALENSDFDEDVTISGKAASMGGSLMGLKKDSVVKMYDLLNGLLICSGNDAAVAIAEHIGGSVESFCEMMNKKAIEIGAYSTSYSNPHGLDAENHYTTAYDLAKITRYALKNLDFNEIVKKREYYFNGRVLKSTNEMLSGYEGADGVKTGYTGLAGRCLVTSATKDDMRFISVVLFCDTKNLRTSSSQKILDYSFTEYGKVFLLERGRIVGSVRVNRSKSLQEVMVVVSEDLSAVLKHSQRDNLYTRISLPENVMAPVRRGSIMGTVSIFQGDQIIAETSLITIDGTQKMKFWDYFKDVIKNWQIMIR